MAQTDDYDSRDDTDWFRDELRQRDRLITELRSERDEQTDLIRRLREHAEDYVASIESWRETFDMEMTEDGKWTWQPFWDRHWNLVDRYNDLVRRWNRLI